MNYIVFEIQNTEGTTAIVPPVVYADRNQAESKFHQILTAAAVSAVEKHATVMLTEDGRIVRTECYMHPYENQEEDEAE